MGFMDKVKAQAEQAVAKAQEGVAQGQAKMGELQAKKAHDALILDLGNAYYASQRSGGSTDAVNAALAAVDAHIATNGVAAGGPAAGGAADAAGAGDAAAGGASFGLDDV